MLYISCTFLQGEIQFEGRLDVKKMWEVSVCRICRMTCWLKSNRGNSAVHPRSLRKMLGAIRNIKFSDKGSISESSKPAGCSESEPISSLVNLQELPTLWTQGEGCNTCPNKNCHNRQVGFRGSRGDTQEKPYGAVRETLTDVSILFGTTGGYKGNEILSGL